MKRINGSRRRGRCASPDRFSGHKHNRPVAKLVAVGGELWAFVGRSRGVIQISDQDLLAPVGDNWVVDADL